MVGCYTSTLPLRHFLVITSIFVFGAESLMEYESMMFEGKHFVVGIIHEPPYIKVGNFNDLEKAGRIANMTAGPLLVDGYVHKILEMLSDLFEFTFEYVHEPDSYYGAKVNGSWNGLVGMLLRDEIDIAAGGLSRTFDRSLAIDFSYGYHDDPLTLLMTYPQLDNLIGGLARPFDQEVWYSIFAIMIICALLLYFIDHLEKKCWNVNMENMTCGSRSDITPRNARSFSYYFMFLLSVLMNQSYRLHRYGWASILVLSAWFLASVVICNAYCQSVRSFLMAPRYVMDVQSIADLSVQHDHQFVTLKYSLPWSMMMSATSGLYGEIGKSLRENPQNALEDHDPFEHLILQEHKVLAQRESSLLWRMQNDYLSTGKCRFYLVDKPFAMSYNAFGLPKMSELNHPISHEIMWLTQYGLLDYWAQLYWPRVNKCSAPLQTDSDGILAKLSLTYLSSAFILLGTGLIASCICFLLELIIFHSHTR